MCLGDCSGDTAVTVDEVLTLVAMALGAQPDWACPLGLPPGTSVDVATIVAAVNHALAACTGR